MQPDEAKSASETACHVRRGAHKKSSPTDRLLPRVQWPRAPRLAMNFVTFVYSVCRTIVSCVIGGATHGSGHHTQPRPVMRSPRALAAGRAARCRGAPGWRPEGALLARPYLRGPARARALQPRPGSPNGSITTVYQACRLDLAREDGTASLTVFEAVNPLGPPGVVADKLTAAATASIVETRNLLHVLVVESVTERCSRPTASRRTPSTLRPCRA